MLGVFTSVFQLLLWFCTFVKNALMGLFGGGDREKDETRENTELPDVRRER